jgi:hypothetical protein
MPLRTRKYIYYVTCLCQISSSLALINSICKLKGHYYQWSRVTLVPFRSFRALKKCLIVKNLLSNLQFFFFKLPGEPSAPVKPCMPTLIIQI